MAFTSQNPTGAVITPVSLEPTVGGLNSSLASTADVDVGGYSAIVVPADQPGASLTNSGTPVSAGTRSAAPGSSTGPSGTASTSAQQNDAPEHVQNLASGLAGAVLSAPLAAVEHFSPAVSQQLSDAGAAVSSTAGSLATSAQQQASALADNPTAQSYLSQGMAYATQAKDAVLSALPGSTAEAQQQAINAKDAVVGAATTASNSVAATLPSADQVRGTASNLQQSAASSLPSSTPFSSSSSTTTAGHSTAVTDLEGAATGHAHVDLNPSDSSEVKSGAGAEIPGNVTHASTTASSTPSSGNLYDSQSATSGLLQSQSSAHQVAEGKKDFGYDNQPSANKDFGSGRPAGGNHSQGTAEVLDTYTQ